MSDSTKTPTDEAASPVHLLDGAAHHLSHAIRHLDRLNEPDGLTSFNAEHATKHAVEAQDHLQRAVGHLHELHPEFADEAARLHAARDDIKKGARKGMSDFLKALPRR